MTPNFTIVRAGIQDIERVLENLRPHDRRELVSVIDPYHHTFIDACLESDICEAIKVGDDTVCILGGRYMWDGVMQVWLFATPCVVNVSRPLTKWLRANLKTMMDNMSVPVHRLVCYSIEGYDVTHRWLELVGFKREAVLPKWGADGATFHMFGLVK